MLNFSRLMIVAIAVATAAPSLAEADPNRPSAVIITPKRNTTVKAEFDLAGRLSVRGRPIVMIRRDTPDAKWRVQKAVEMTGTRNFKGKVHLNDERAVYGDRFWVLVITPTTAQFAFQRPTEN